MLERNAWKKTIFDFTSASLLYANLSNSLFCVMTNCLLKSNFKKREIAKKERESKFKLNSIN